MAAKTLNILLPALITTTSLAAAWALMAEKPRGHPEKPERELPVAETLVARPETLRLNVKTQGVVSARSEIDLVSEVSGKVVRVHPAFAAGGFFEAGNTLVMIDPRDYDFAVIRMEANVAEAQRELLREEAEAEQAEQEWQALGSGEPSDYALHRPHLREWRAKLAQRKRTWPKPACGAPAAS